MENLINKIKANLVSKIQNIRITRFTNSLIVNGKGVVKSITVHSRHSPYNNDTNDFMIIIDEVPLIIKTDELYTTSTYQGENHFTLNEVIPFDKKFEIKVNNQNAHGFATYIIE